MMTSSFVGHHSSSPPPGRTKVCCDCKERKPWSEYWARTKWDDGSMRTPLSRCKLCESARNKAKHASDPEKWQRYWRERWAAKRKNPETDAIILMQQRDRRGVTPDRWRKNVGRMSLHTGESLPPEPFAEWLRGALRDMDGDLTRLATASGVSVETLRRIVNRRVPAVDLGTVETVLCAHGSRTLGDLYG